MIVRRLTLFVAFALLCSMSAGVAAAAPAATVASEGLPVVGESPHSGIGADGRVWFVPMQRKEIALTFDDGPYPFYTPLLLHQLESENVPATFFLVGRTVQEYPQLVERIVASGSEIGNHTFNHISLTGLSPEEIQDQIADCGTILEQYTGSQPTLFRPPHGRYDTRVVEVARALGYRTILWNDAPDDAPANNVEVPVPVIVQRVVEQAKPGGIVLLHNGQYNTALALPAIIEQLRDDGYSFVTVSQLLTDQE